MEPLSIELVVFSISLALFIVSFVGMLLRKVAVWVLLGQLLLLKTLAATAFICARMEFSAGKDTLLLSYCAVGSLPLLLGAGMLVLHRASYRGGSLSMAEKGELKN